MMNYLSMYHHKSVLYSVLLLFLFIALITGRSCSSSYPEWQLKNEEPCLSAGGICIVAEYCEEGYKANGTGLCPTQEPIAACCHKVPDIATCSQKGGHCIKDCGILQGLGPSDCEEGTTCCPLI